MTPEGYYNPVTANYYYYLKDHLGNNRVTYHYSGSVPVIDQEVEYYPFGSMFVANNLQNNLYLYNGKELNNEFFENYDYGARFYDPQIGRWHVVDPRAEKYYSLSPYSYCANNPVLFIDPNGDTISVTTNDGKYLFMLDDGNDGVTTMTAKALYDQGTQWFEPEADNYMPLIGTAEGLEGFSELKHFTWEQIINFSEEDRWMMSYRQGGSGDWKASKEGAAGYFLVTVDGKPYWADAIGQIPFAVDKYTDELMRNKGNTERSVLNTIDAGREYGEGRLVGGTRDNTNTYDNYFILRGSLWAKQRYIMLYDKNNKSYLYNTGRSNNYLKTPITPSLRNKYLR